MGDGDLGSGVSRGCAAILNILDYLDFESKLIEAFSTIGEVLSNSIAGTSGPLYGYLFLRLIHNFNF